MSKRKRYIRVLLLVSIALNVVMFSLDVLPYLYPRVKKCFFKEQTISKLDSATENVLIGTSMKMARSSRVTMVWDDPKGATYTMLKMASTRSQSEFRKFNYPRAFLYYGLSSYFKKRGDSDNMEDFKKTFDQFLDQDGEPLFSINRVDQIPFGLAALNLYQVFKEEKYVTFADRLYEFILESIGDDGVISYRKGQQLVLSDMLGLVVPFLVEYYNVNANATSLAIARSQISFYTKYGIDHQSFLPAHAIERNEKIKLGPLNWGRGIGWYFMALAELHNATGEFESEYNGLLNTLKGLRNSDGLWSQFPGSSDSFDASATLMIVYSAMVNDDDLFNKEELFEHLKPYISDEGMILNTSGDTYSVNNYSTTFGKSELSQGMLLLTLALL